MSFTSWLQNLRSALAPGRGQRHHGRRGSLRAATHRLNVEVLEDRLTPSFAAPVGYAAGAAFEAVVTADFNGDGRLDLATANYGDYTVSVLLGNANGTFQPAVTCDAGYAPLSLAVGDFNKDGKLDLATANVYDVNVMLGNGDGTFNPPSSYGVVGNPDSVAVGEFNGDGLLDLGVASNNYTPGFYDDWGSWVYGYSSAYANVLLGDGTGGFSGPNATFIDSYAYANSALAADLNGDLYDDFVTFDSSGYVTPLLGDSSGYLQGPTGYFYTGDYTYAVATGDLDGDGANDLVTTNFYGNSVGVLLGDGTGSFSGPTNYDVGGYPTSIVLGDFTHDGKLDVATSNHYSDQVSVLYGDGHGAFSTPARSATGSNPIDIAAGDFNGDGWLDAATANLGDYSVSVLINDQVWPDPPPPPPSVSINDVTVTEGNTGTTNATFTISLSKASSQDVTVHYQTADGTADGSDYTGTSGDVTILAGQTTYLVTIDVTGDRLAEPTETFAVNLSAPVNATICNGQGIGTILDDEPYVSINDVTVTEGTGTSSVNATFKVSLSAVSDVDVTVHYDTANITATAGSDYTAGSGDVTIPAGQTSRTFTVAVKGDRLAEPTETFAVNLSAPTNATIGDGQGIGTILDNEPRISISDVTKSEGTTKGNAKKTTLFTFTVTLSAAYDQAVTMSFRTVDGTATTGDSDYIARTGTLTFAPGETTKTITIEVNGDNKKEGNETFYLDLTGLSSNGLFTKSRGVGTILNDD
jgi:Calx-beta domain/FG-GAP-like repeat